MVDEEINPYRLPVNEDGSGSVDNPLQSRGPLSRWPSWDYARPALVMYALFIVGSLLYWQTPWGDLLWVSGESLLSRREIWRAVSYIGVHADAVHLLSNTPLFIIFGWLIHAYFGKLLFPCASILTGVIASVITVMIYEPNVRLVGASGMVYGMVALWLVYYIRYDTERRISSRVIRAVGFALIMLSPTVYNPAVSYMAHGVGFAAGLAIALLLLPFVHPRREFVEERDQDAEDRQL